MHNNLHPPWLGTAACDCVVATAAPPLVYTPALLSCACVRGECMESDAPARGVAMSARRMAPLRISSLPAKLPRGSAAGVCILLLSASAAPPAAEAARPTSRGTFGAAVAACVHACMCACAQHTQGGGGIRQRHANTYKHPPSHPAGQLKAQSVQAPAPR